MAKRKQIRQTVFDRMQPENLYCRRDDLDNESSVEKFFADRMLKDFGYKDSQIQTKKSISDIIVAVGSKRVRYKPDYVVTFRGSPRWVLDAKATDEPLDKWEAQCGGYCLALNQRTTRGNPVQWYVLCNGLETRLYKWDQADPIVTISFEEFTRGHPLYEKLRAVLGVKAMASPGDAGMPDTKTFAITRPTPEEARREFVRCHNAIRKAEGYNPTTAFLEFTKVMFVKLWADRTLREDPSIEALLREGKPTKVPRESVSFSVHWIEAHERETENPVNDILFRTLRDRIEKDIVRGNKKRIFDSDEDIELRPDTLKSIVGRLEHYDMFGIDEDLNGRLFETFLSATMRGKELGQFFTPRSIVKLMIRLAGLRISRGHIDSVIDACCGTGGFLIEALTDMRNKLRADRSLSDREKKQLMDELANECLFGIDFGKSPFIARIARINMYLHGDGGSRVYYGEGLDKSMQPIPGQMPEVLKNQEELGGLIEEGLTFDVVLTNPPFAMTKELKNPSEARILKQYDLARFDAGAQRYRQSLRSSAMFIERYWGLLRPRGKLLTIIDETVLSSGEYDFVRDFIRERFLIRAVISLHGDAFRMAGSRVKTSILYLERKEDLSEKQPAVFMYASLYLGVDNLPVSRRASEVREARSLAEKETEAICEGFRKYENGEVGSWLVGPGRVEDRLDVKYCMPQQGRFIERWRKKGYDVARVCELAQPAKRAFDPRKRPCTEFALLQVSYAGQVEIQERIAGREIQGTNMKRVKAGDLVVSRYNALHGAVGVVPEEYEGAIASGSFLVLECKRKADLPYLWSILRTTEIRADILSAAVGLGRQTINWEDLKQVQIPLLPVAERKRLASKVRTAWKKEGETRRDLEAVARTLDAEFDVESEESKKRFDAHRPPR